MNQQAARGGVHFLDRGCGATRPQANDGRKIKAVRASRVLLERRYREAALGQSPVTSGERLTREAIGLDQAVDVVPLGVPAPSAKLQRTPQAGAGLE